MRAKLRRWFVGGPELDRLIQDRFGYLVEQATRNLYRDTPRAFAGDGHAIRRALEALDRRLAAEYSLEDTLCEGKRRDGSELSPAMPWQATRGLSDDEIQALWLALRGTYGY